MSGAKNSLYGTKSRSTTKSRDDSTALTAVAFQDHLIRSLSLGNPLKTKQKLGHKPIKKSVPHSIVDSGLRKKGKNPDGDVKDSNEYVLDAKLPPLTLAQRMGLVEAPESQLTENDWSSVKERSNKRDDSKQPCVICKDDFGKTEQVLLSCSHVFHRACLEAFERFTGKKTCPMCRKEQYQTRVIHEGAKYHKHQCATRIQATWRGYVVRCWYQKLRKSIVPKDPILRKTFYEGKFHEITDRIVRSLDCNVNHFLQEIDRDLQASRDIFNQFDNAMAIITDDKWEQIQLQAVERGETECPICLTSLDERGYSLETVSGERSELEVSVQKRNSSKTVLKNKNIPRVKKNNKTDIAELDSCTTVGVGASCPSQRKCTRTKAQILLSCSHVFHKTCLETFEELSLVSRHHLCPVCRTAYQKKIL